MTRKHFSTGTPWEPVVGYSRAIRVGPHVHVSGTTATNAEGELVGHGDAGAQARQIFANLSAALGAVGASFEHVVRTRTYVLDIQRDWEAVGRVHGEFLGEALPATSMLEVSGLIDPDMLVEIEVEAIVLE